MSDKSFSAKNGLNVNGSLLVANASTNRVSINSSSASVTFEVSANDAIKVPIGNTSQRPTGANGYVRYNSETASFEGYANGGWGALSTTTAIAGSNTQIQFNDSGSLGGSAGFVFNKTTNNITIANTLTIGTGTINTTVYSGSANNSTYLNGQLASYYTAIATRLGYTPVNQAGDTMTGALTVSGAVQANGGGLIVKNGDLTSYRVGGTTGTIILNAAGTRYLLFDGSKYIFPSANVTINGSDAWTVATLANVSQLVNDSAYYKAGDTAAFAAPLTAGSSNVWTVATLTNLNQLTNGPAYITTSATVQMALRVQMYSNTTQTTANGQFIWAANTGQPTGVWGSTDGASMYYWSPANLNCNNALTANNASYLNGVTSSGFASNNSNFRFNSLGVGVAATGSAGELICTGDITAFYSDERLKTGFSNIENPLKKVMQLNGMYYTQNKLAEQYGYNDYKRQVGLIAQDVQKVMKEAVSLAPFDINTDGTSMSGQNFLTVNYAKLVPLLVEAIKELNDRIDKLT